MDDRIKGRFRPAAFSMSDAPRQILFSFADRVVGAVLDGLKGETVESIFVSGGAGRGDIAGFEGPEGIEVYSDLDVYVVVREPRDLDAIRRVARRAAARVPREGEGYRIFPEPDVGVYTEDDFLRQKTRPGTVEIAGSHVVLYGNEKTPLQADRFVTGAIEPSEGLYLVENRLAEIAGLVDRLEHDRSDGFGRYVSYVRLKSGVDAVSAVLISFGRFHPSRDERITRFREAFSRDEWSGFLREVWVSRIEQCYADLKTLQNTFEKDRGSSPGPGGEVETMLLGVWRGMATRTSPRRNEDWAGLLDWRCKRGRWLANARELSALARRMGVPRARVFARSATLARFSPVDALRLSGTVEALLRRGDGERADGPLRVNAIEKGYVAVIDGLTRAFGHGSGPVFRRARRLFEETA